MGRIVFVVLNQNDKDSLSATALEKLVREQIGISEIAKHSFVEKITVLEDASASNSSVIKAAQK